MTWYSRRRSRRNDRLYDVFASDLPAGPAAAECCAPSAGLDPALDAERIAAVAKALAEPLRVQVLDVLRRSEQHVCQCELVPLFGITQPLLSHHMRKLIDAGLVKWSAATSGPTTPSTPTL